MATTFYRRRANARGGAALVLLVIAGSATARAGVVTEEDFVVVKASRVITATGEEFAPGIIVLADGKISLVGGDVEYPGSATVIDATGQTVMPGFVLPRSRYRLDRYKRTGVHGDQNAATDVYLSHIDFDDLLRAGYTTVCFVPDGQDIPGLACAYHTAGSDDESRRLGDSTYLDVALRWDAKGKGKKLLRDALKKAKQEIEKVEKARKEWEEQQKKAKEEAEKKKKENGDDDGDDEEDEEGDGDDEHSARAGKQSGNSVAASFEDEPDEPDDGDGDDDEPKPKNGDNGKPKEETEFKPPPIDPKLQPLVDLLQQKDSARMMIRLDRSSDLLHLDDVLEPYDDMPYALYLGQRWVTATYEDVIDKLGERKAKVVAYPIMRRLPYTVTRFNAFARMASAGCQVAALPLSDSRSALLQVRARLAQLVRAGLSRDDAIKALTLYAAGAIGLEAQLGSIEKDKDGDLVFLDGDPLDPHASVQRVMIRGKIVWEADHK